jgi:hypothetical protein
MPAGMGGGEVKSAGVCSLYHNMDELAPISSERLPTLLHDVAAMQWVPFIHNPHPETQCNRFGDYSVPESKFLDRGCHVLYVNKGRLASLRRSEI